MSDPRRWLMHLAPPRFVSHTKQQGGFLTDVPECHALWNYYLMARGTYELVELGTEIQYDDSTITSTQTRYRQQLESCALLHGVEPEAMVRYWDDVDAQCILMQLPLMPKGERYRFNEAPAIFLSSRIH